MTRLTKIALKKKGNCNVVATWPRHVILLVITSNNISLSPPIALTHCLIPDGSPFWYTKPHSSIVGNRFSYIALLGSAPAAIPPSFYRNFDFYSPSSHLLGLNLFSSGFVGIQIIPQSFAINEGLQNRTNLGWHLYWEDVTSLWSVGVRPKEISVTRLKIYGTLNVAKHGSLVSV